MFALILMERTITIIILRSKNIKNSKKLNNMNSNRGELDDEGMDDEDDVDTGSNTQGTYTIYNQ